MPDILDDTEVPALEADEEAGALVPVSAVSDTDPTLAVPRKRPFTDFKLPAWVKDDTVPVPDRFFLLFGDYANNTAIPANRIVLFSGDAYWTNSDIPDDNVVEPIANSAFELLTGVTAAQILQFLPEHMLILDVSLSPPYFNPDNIEEDYYGYVRTLNNAFEDATQVQLEINGVKGSARPYNPLDGQGGFDLSVTLGQSARGGIAGILTTSHEFPIFINFLEADDTLVYQHRVDIPRARISQSGSPDAGASAVFAARAERIRFNALTNISDTAQAAVVKSTSPIDVRHGSGDNKLIDTVSGQTGQILFKEPTIYDVHLEGAINIKGSGSTRRSLPKVILNHNDNYIGEIDDHYHRTDNTAANINNQIISGHGTIYVPTANYIVTATIENEIKGSQGSNFDIRQDWSLTFSPKGVKGDQGYQGRFQVNIYRTITGAIPTTAPTGGVFTYDGGGLTPPTDWSLTPTTPSAGETVIKSTATIDYANQSGDTLTPIWSAPVPDGVNLPSWVAGDTDIPDAKIPDKFKIVDVVLEPNFIQSGNIPNQIKGFIKTEGNAYSRATKIRMAIRPTVVGDSVALSTSDGRVGQPVLNLNATHKAAIQAIIDAGNTIGLEFDFLTDIDAITGEFSTIIPYTTIPSGSGGVTEEENKFEWVNVPPDRNVYLGFRAAGYNFGGGIERDPENQYPQNEADGGQLGWGYSWYAMSGKAFYINPSGGSGNFNVRLLDLGGIRGANRGDDIDGSTCLIINGSPVNGRSIDFQGSGLATIIPPTAIIPPQSSALISFTSVGSGATETYRMLVSPLGSMPDADDPPLFGPGVPANNLGEVGNTYYRTDGKVYVKTGSSTWAERIDLATQAELDVVKSNITVVENKIPRILVSAYPNYYVKDGLAKNFAIEINSIDPSRLSGVNQVVVNIQTIRVHTTAFTPSTVPQMIIAALTAAEATTIDNNVGAATDVELEVQFRTAADPAVYAAGDTLVYRYRRRLAAFATDPYATLQWVTQQGYASQGYARPAPVELWSGTLNANTTPPHEELKSGSSFLHHRLLIFEWEIFPIVSATSVSFRAGNSVGGKTSAISGTPHAFVTWIDNTHFRYQIIGTQGQPLKRIYGIP